MNIIKTKATGNRGFFTFLLLLFFYLGVVGQDAQIKHFQKKAKVEQLILPNQPFNSSLFTIHFPDSIYSKGTITVNKLIIGEQKAKAIFYFTNNQYTKAIYVCNKKNRDKLILLLKDVTGVKISEKERKGKTIIEVTAK